MARVANGDRLAFAVLYDELAPTIYGVVRRVVREPAQSEEITREVFVEVWRQAPRFDPARGDVSSWAVLIARRRAVDSVRSRTSFRDRRWPAATEPAASPDGDRARSALTQLTDAQHQALELAFFGAHSRVEIAEHLGVGVGTVTTRIRDGLALLRS